MYQMIPTIIFSLMVYLFFPNLARSIEKSVHQQSIEAAVNYLRKSTNKNTGNNNAQIKQRLGAKPELLKTVEVFVFPKIIGNNPIDVEKEHLSENNSDKSISVHELQELEEGLIQYGKPVLYHFSFPRNQVCSLMAKDPAFSAKEVFKSEEKVRNLNCFVIKISAPYKEKFNKDDIKEMVVYMNENFAPFAKKIVYQTNVHNTREVSFVENASLFSMSELTGYPVDLPHLAKVKWVTGRVRVPENIYIKGMIKNSKLFANNRRMACQDGFLTDYQDSLGNPIKVGWCRNDDWPTMIESPNYFAILRLTTSGRGN